MITENENQDDAPKKALIYICGGKYDVKIGNVIIIVFQQYTFCVYVHLNDKIFNNNNNNTLYMYNNSVPSGK